MKILHFSDIHTGGHFNSLKSLFDKRIIGTINYRLRRKKHVHWDRLDRAIEIIKNEKPDVVINTGDITSVSESSEFLEAKNRLEPLVKEDSFLFLNVPGNHDYYIDSQLHFADRNTTYSYLNRAAFELEELPLKIETKAATFILVDESRPNKGSQSSGHITNEAIKKIEKWTSIKQEKPYILVGHYPLKDKLGNPLAQRRHLENSEPLLSLLENGKINVTLCGHIHAPFIRKENSGALEVCAGSLTIGGKLNKLELNESTGEFTHSWIDLN
ncbi:MAG: metallophosphoesterase [Lentisphaeraceae bacterium]|nr:metallophosphoesterase [Lentisphaeraceae bacterium]